MQQVIQNLRSGETRLVDVPVPALKDGHLLIESTCSLISSGTERMIVDFARSGVINKARQQPEKVKQVLAKMRTDGFLSTVDAVRNKLDEPLALGYSNVGRVIAVGRNVEGLVIGDRVASNGGHAEIVCVPRNLCARVPDGVDDESAAFTVVGAIALQGIRLAQPTLGESVVVFGLGLIGLLTVELLLANGCRVLGMDFSADRLTAAREMGADVFDLSSGADPVSAALQFSLNNGVDAAIITASTRSDEVVSQAAKMSRKRGRIILVGVVGLKLDRSDFYEKELSFQVSCSYGPGRYDPTYEQQGQDYPFGYVRWTEQRNFEAVLDMVSRGRLKPRNLITHRFQLQNAIDAYGLIMSKQPSLGVLMSYTEKVAGKETKTPVAVASKTLQHAAPARSLGFIGAGQYAKGMLMPAFQKAGTMFTVVVANNGVMANHAREKFGFAKASSEAEDLLSDANTASVAIATRHDSHAHYVGRALKAGKHVFVEKPLAIDEEGLTSIVDLYQQLSLDGKAPLVMVGFNRRFSPLTLKLKSLLDNVRSPKAFVMTVNAGSIDAGHWTQNASSGGGRIVGEACHFIDLLRHLAASPIAKSSATYMTASESDTAVLTLKFEDGSIGTINYFANGNKAFPKERLEVFAGGGVLVLDNFLTLKGFGWRGFKKMSLWKQDKGQLACTKAFLDAVVGQAKSPIDFAELKEVAAVTIALSKQIN